MKVISWNELNKKTKPLTQSVAITNGVFDGVHKGHKALIIKLTEEKEYLPVIVTYRENPMQMLNAKYYKGDILSLDQKLVCFAALGIRAVILIDFSHDFSKLSGREFFGILQEKCNLKYLILGRNHHLGYKGKTSAHMAKNILEPEGVKVDIIKPVIFNNQPISSSRIRNAIIEGDFSLVEEMMGRTFSIDLENIKYETKGTQIVLKKDKIDQIFPKEGTYNTRITGDNFTFETETKVFKNEILWEQSEINIINKIEFLN